jgi:hypothetical protein
MALDEKTVAETNKRIYDSFKEDFCKDIGTWKSFYEKMAERFTRFTKCGCYNCASTYIYLNRAFLLAMEEMPEEGDIVNIVERMAHILAFEHKEKLGIDPHAPRSSMVDPVTQLRNLVTGSQMLSQALSEVLGDDDADSVGEGQPHEAMDVKKLH